VISFGQILRGKTPGKSLDTPGLGYSGYKPGNSGLRSPDTPDMNPDIPGFIRTVGCRIG
jgi:hypothetical protein